eukprot:359100-Chlamydomonas_euryale.AAC.3
MSNFPRRVGPHLQARQLLHQQLQAVKRQRPTSGDAWRGVAGVHHRRGGALPGHVNTQAQLVEHTRRLVQLERHVCAARRGSVGGAGGIG